jgi:hypothetical protein
LDEYSNVNGKSHTSKLLFPKYRKRSKLPKDETSSEERVHEYSGVKAKSHYLKKILAKV